MTADGNKCLFHLTIPAEQMGILDSRCPRFPTRSIAGFDEGRMISLDFCEGHYLIMEQWLDAPCKDEEIKK